MKLNEYSVCFSSLVYLLYDNTFTEEVDIGVSPLVTVTGESTLHYACVHTHVYMYNVYNCGCKLIQALDSALR